MRIFSNTGRRYSMMNSGWPYSTGWPLSTRIALIMPVASASHHRGDEADRLAHLDVLADLEERLGIRRGRPVEGAHHGSLEHVAGLGGLLGGDRGCRRWLGCRPRRLHGGRARRRARRHRGDRCLPALHDLDLFFALCDLELGDAGLLHEVDQLLQLAQIHSFFLLPACRNGPPRGKRG
jgi:hypothetical protein